MLEEINLEHNLIKEIPEKFLQNCTKLKIITLSENYIVEIPKEFLCTC